MNNYTSSVHIPIYFTKNIGKGRNERNIVVSTTDFSISQDQYKHQLYITTYQGYMHPYLYDTKHRKTVRDGCNTDVATTDSRISPDRYDMSYE